VLISPEVLLQGCVRTLLEAVLPDVSSRFARGQLYAVADVLRNLEARVEEKGALFAAEAASARGALGRARDALGADPLAGEIARDLAESEVLAPREAAERLRAGLVAALETLHARPDGESDPARVARSALGAHVAAQALRDVSLLKPSLLREISKG
jgi:hypothetical protein